MSQPQPPQPPPQTTTPSTDVEVGFAKLQGEDFEYYMQTYSIILGRNSKKSTVDVDLASLGGGMRNISRHHARIFYDFQRRCFALEVLGKNGCLVDRVLHLPGTAPVKLESQNLLKIGDKEFYFLLPVRNILGGMGGGGGGRGYGYGGNGQVRGRREKGWGEGESEEYGEEKEEREREDVGGKRVRRFEDGGGSGGVGDVGAGKGGFGESLTKEKKSDGRSRNDPEADNQQEEKDVVSSVATVLSDLCGPGEWMPMERLHAELMEQYGNVWHHSRVRRYLTTEDWSAAEAEGKPWHGLLMLLRKYPEHFVINRRSKGRVTLEFVSLVSLLS